MIGSRDPREAKLPVWAQKQIDLLRSNLEHERARLRTVTGEVQPSSIIVEPYKKPLHFLPGDHTVRFFPGGPPGDCVSMRGEYVDVRLRGGWVEVMGGSQLMVRPQVSNVIAVRCEER